MIIQVTGTTTRNKGAELMLAAAALHFHQHHPQVQVAVTPHAGAFVQRCRYELLQVNHLGLDTLSGLGMRLLAASTRKAFGIVRPGEVDVVLDASGYAFGDSLGLERVETFGREVRDWKAAGKKVILLPQAVGPFESVDIGRAFRQVVEQADRVYLRDNKSYGFALHAGADEKKLRLAPDFTCNVEPAPLPQGFDPHNYVALVPNVRLVEQGICSEERWRAFARELCQFVANQGWKPVLLVHDDSGEDRKLIGDLGETSDYQVFWHDDPRVLKAVIGSARLVVGSRYHSLVSALSQGIPTIALGWTHKYEELLLEYGCPTCEASLENWWDVLREVLPRIKSQASWQSWHYALLHEAVLVREKVAGLWLDIESLLGLEPSMPAGDQQDGG